MTVLETRTAESVFVVGAHRDHEVLVLPGALVLRDLGHDLRLDQDTAVTLGSCLVVAGAALSHPERCEGHLCPIGTVVVRAGGRLVRLDVDVVLDEVEGMQSVLLTCEDLDLDVTLDGATASRLGRLVLTRA